MRTCICSNCGTFEGWRWCRYCDLYGEPRDFSKDPDKEACDFCFVSKEKPLELAMPDPEIEVISTTLNPTGELNYED